jgi:hypothetical protein
MIDETYAVFQAWDFALWEAKSGRTNDIAGAPCFVRQPAWAITTADRCCVIAG